jgi:hypothetical protein
MINPVLDVFRFQALPTAPFPYMGAMWLLECGVGEGGDYWQCGTTVPLRLPLAVAEDQRALKIQLTKFGVPAVRNTQQWFLLRHLEKLGFTQQLDASRS